MAKATMTAYDGDGGLTISVEFDPPPEKGQRELTPAQAFMFDICAELSDGIASAASDALDRWIADDEDS